MNAYIMVHGPSERTGEAEGKSNPGLSSVGARRIVDLLPLPQGIPLVICGTGRRHIETLELISKTIRGIPVRYSPFCGNADIIEQYKAGLKVTLPDGTEVDKSDYTGLTTMLWMNYFKWLSMSPTDTLFITDPDFLTAIGYDQGGGFGRLYRFDGKKTTQIG